MICSKLASARKPSASARFASKFCGQPATMPMIVVTMIPPGSSPGRIALAMMPASRPSTIVATMTMRVTRPVARPRSLSGAGVLGRGRMGRGPAITRRDETIYGMVIGALG